MANNFNNKKEAARGAALSRWTKIPPLLMRGWSDALANSATLSSILAEDS
jgi:hypothetical protein